ncbi:MAG TPA: guanylate kinase [Firmicutes bacterium]|nr:guanylate kinase [Candidatus Fermentithermobacillaceae bacterium]
MSRGILFVITAPSGCGKGTLRRNLLASDPGLTFCPSVTTRLPRPGETNGVDYFFMSREEFLSMRDRQELVEWASVYGNLYGTPGKPIQEALERGVDVILEKDVQGARTLRSLYPEGVFVFVLPPSMDELRRRILGRGTENEEERRLRLECAEMEMSDLSTYDYVIINSDLDRATERLSAIVAGERARSKRRTANDD